MRLIDADELINQGYEMVVDGLQYDTCNKSIDIDNIPTAYDINKVVEELNKAKHNLFFKASQIFGPNNFNSELQTLSKYLFYGKAA